MPGGAGINFHNDPAAGGWQVLASLQHGTNIAIDPDVAVDEQDRFPASFCWQPLPQPRLDGQSPARSCSPHCGCGQSTPERRHTRLVKGLYHPPGTAVEIHHRPAAPRYHQLINVLSAGRPTHRVQREHASVGSGTPHRTSRVQLVEDQIGPRRPRERRAWSCENSNPGKRSAT